MILEYQSFSVYAFNLLSKRLLKPPALAGRNWSYSRSRVSNDNPYAEFLFSVTKYRPNYPEQRCLTNLEQAKAWVDAFVQ